MRANILMLGLDDSLADELRLALRNSEHGISSAPSGPAAAAADHVLRAKADVVFCDLDSRNLSAFLKQLQERACEIPVVVASRLPDISRWLDAMDLGAWDYCASPFEARFLEHMVTGAIRARQQ